MRSIALVLALAPVCALKTDLVHFDVAPSSSPSQDLLTPKRSPRAPAAEPSDQFALPCLDESDDCKPWAASGECQRNAAFMTSNCRAACGLCTPSAEERAAADRRTCKDLDPNCGTWASIGECEANPGFMQTTCRVSCHICPSERCFDSATDCAERAAGHGCYTKPGMREECAFTCRACNVKSDARCARDRSIPPAATVGSVNAMFERISKTSHLGPGRNGTVHVVSRDPWLIMIDDFLSDAETEAMRKAGDKGWHRSLAGDGVHEVRTSSTSWCTGSCLHDPAVGAVQDRVTQLTGVPTENGEFLQILRYQETQFYGTHSDQNAPRASAWGPRLYTFYMCALARAPRLGAARVARCLSRRARGSPSPIHPAPRCPRRYLNDVESGGGTRFPKLNVTVTPKKGRAAMWASVLDSDPYARETRTDHEALPPGPGAVKYGCNFWLHMYPFRELSNRGCSNSLYAENWY